MASLGQQPLATLPLGGSYETPPEAKKFRVIFEIPKESFHEIQPRFNTDGADKYWSILAHGPNVKLSTGRNTVIRQ